MRFSTRPNAPSLGRLVKRFALILLILVVIFLNGNKYGYAASDHISIGTLDTLTSLDPGDSADYFSWEVLTHLYTGLTRQQTGTLRYELALAASHTVSVDGLTHTFTIRADAAFSDGTSITAQTFANSINRAAALKGAIAIKPFIKSVSVSSDGALVITLLAPIPYLEQLLALPPYFPVSAGKTNGIYKVATNGFEAGTSITLTADPAWKGNPPAATTITIRHFASPADLRDALITHQLDMAWRGLPADDMRIAGAVNGIKTQSVPGLQSFYLVLNTASVPFNDPLARQSLVYLLDRERAVQVGLGDNATPLYQFAPPEIDSAAPKFPANNPPQAVALLAQGNYSQYQRIDSELQFSLELYGQANNSAVDQLARTLGEQAALRINRANSDRKTFFDLLDRGSYKMIVVGYSPLIPHTQAYLQFLLSAQSGLHSGYALAAIDSQLARAALDTNPDDQTTHYHAIETQALQGAVVIPLWQGKQAVLSWSQIGNIQIEPNFLLRYDRLTVTP